MNIDHIDVVVSLMVVACSLLLVCCVMASNDPNKTDREGWAIEWFFVASTTLLAIASVLYFFPLQRYEMPDFSGAEVARMKVIHK